MCITTTFKKTIGTAIVVNLFHITPEELGMLEQGHQTTLLYHMKNSYVTSASRLQVVGGCNFPYFVCATNSRPEVEGAMMCEINVT